jgi:hypothetical protein
LISLVNRIKRLSAVPRPAKVSGRNRLRGRRKVGKELPPKQKFQTQKIQLIARKGQPRPFARVPVLIRGEAGGPVASTWISRLEWDVKNRDALMLLDNGYFYKIKMSWKQFQAWYYAPSKGTYFNEFIKGKRTVTRLNK